MITPTTYPLSAPLAFLKGKVKVRVKVDMRSETATTTTDVWSSADTQMPVE
jgi:NADH:ubiquinone oxidoreductase subunit C